MPGRRKVLIGHRSTWRMRVRTIREVPVWLERNPAPATRLRLWTIGSRRWWGVSSGAWSRCHAFAGSGRVATRWSVVSKALGTDRSGLAAIAIPGREEEAAQRGDSAWLSSPGSAACRGWRQTSRCAGRNRPRPSVQPPRRMRRTVSLFKWTGLALPAPAQRPTARLPAGPLRSVHGPGAPEGAPDCSLLLSTVGTAAAFRKLVPDADTGTREHSQRD